MKKALLISIAMIAILATTIVPAYAWVIPPNPAGEDGKYELFGPHVKGILIEIYTGTTTEWAAMNQGKIDFEDWALDKPTADAWSTVGGPITEANYGGELGYMLLDINNNATIWPTDAGPGIPNPTSDLFLRQAIAYCVNRSWIVNDLCGGLANPMYTLVPTMMGGYVNHDIRPGGTLEALTYGGYQGNVTQAKAILDAHDFPIGSDGWRFWDKNGNSVKDAGEDLNLIFYSRGGQRGDFGDYLNTVLTSVPIKIQTTYQGHVARSTVTGPVFAQEDFNLYTGGWSLGMPTPDFLCDLYNGSNYYHPGSPENYGGINYADLNANLTAVKLASSIAAGTAAALSSQICFAEHCASVPLWNAAGAKAFKNVPVEGGGNWTQMENTLGFGIDSWWSTLNMYKQGDMYPNFTYYGFSSDISLLNPVYSQWLWDWNVIGRIYDVGATLEPTTLVAYVPQLFKSWVVGTWADPSAGGEIKTKVTITLRPDVYWQDGQPLTMADVYYTLVESSKDILAKGLPPPWWYPTVQYMKSIEIIDPYNMEVLLDVNSVWALGWVLGSTIIPMHIWKPIVDASSVSNPLVMGTQPDANIIGTGPFRFLSYTPSASVVLVANRPGSVVNSITSPGYYNYNPVWVDVNPDNGLSKINISPTDASVLSNVTISINNLWQGGNLTGTKYVYLNGALQGSPLDLTLTSVPIWNATNPYVKPSGTGASDVETLQFTLLKKTLNIVKVAFKITGPAPWVGTWANVTLPLYVTVKQDFGGSTLCADLAPYLPGYGSVPTSVKNVVPTPDLKVDIVDIFTCAKAFGAYPGDFNWNSASDVNGDYKVDIVDIFLIAKTFGY